MSDALLDGFLTRLEDRTAKIVVVGQGYVGLSIAMRASGLGFRVVGYDTSPKRVHALRDARSFVDDIPSDDIRTALEAGYAPTGDPYQLRGFDVAVITVPTPLREGTPDLSFIETSARDIAQWLERGALVTLESTTYPGTTEELLRPNLEGTGLQVGQDIFLGYSPERIDPGSTSWTFVNTPIPTYKQWKRLFSRRRPPSLSDLLGRYVLVMRAVQDYRDRGMPPKPDWIRELGVKF